VPINLKKILWRGMSRFLNRLFALLCGVCLSSGLGSFPGPMGIEQKRPILL
jgi:hypothetical protein